MPPSFRFYSRQSELERVPLRQLMSPAAMKPMSDRPIETPALKPHRRIIELDALRALAAINLVLFHLTHVYEVKFGYVESLGWEWPYGAYGVELFFILSGFVNSMSLMRRGQPVDFVAARMIRIVPIFLMVILFNVWIMTMQPLTQTPLTVAQLAANLTLMPRVLGQECIDPVMWTLQIEILFYGLLVSLYRLGGLKRYFLGWGVLCGLSLAVCPTLDAVSATHGEAWWFTIANSVRRLLILDFAPLFAIGFLLYMIKTRTGSRIGNGIAMVVAATVFHCIDHGKHNPVATMLIIGLVTAAAYGKLPMLRLRPFVVISTLSYALYLCHNNLGCVLIHRLNQGGWSSNISLAIVALFSFCFAYLITAWIDQPLNRRLRDAWVRIRKQESVAPVTQAT
ncbi:MAG: acyltransferase [Planctomycetota bacterium]